MDLSLSREAEAYGIPAPVVRSGLFMEYVRA